MSTSPSIGPVPVNYLIFLIITISILLLIVWLLQKHTRQEKPGARPATVKSLPVRVLFHMAKLIGFGLMAFVVIVISLMFYAAYEDVPVGSLHRL